MAYNQQPRPTEQMKAGGNLNANNMPFVDGEREWSHGIFDCLADPLTCVVSWFLPCVSHGRNMARYQALEQNSVSKDPMEGVISNDSIIYGAAQCFGCGGLVGMGGRATIRGRYSVQGTGVSDCLLSCCCAPCSLTQISRELELEEQNQGHPGAGFGMFMQPAAKA